MKSRTIYNFNNTHTLLGEDFNHPVVQAEFHSIENEFSSSLTIHEPAFEDIIDQRDLWKCYDLQDHGILVEIVNDIVAAISYANGIPTIDGQIPMKRYPFILPYEFSFEMNRAEIKKRFGSPAKSTDLFDQYQEDNRTIGVLFSELSGEISVITFGVSRIFSDPEKRPNRYSIIFDSIT